MCGIVGFINRDYKINLNESNILRMTQVLSHRGPDYSNVWKNINKDVYLGHSRLSILDLSSNGNQPMNSFDGQYVLVFNGEIYNHLEIRNDLKKVLPEGFNWKGMSDSETLINCISLIGITETLKKISGMFAFAFYDNKKEILTLVRDKSGEKPLYYGFINNTFVFASELKAFKINSNFDNNLDKDSLAKFFRYSYIPAPHSIFKNIYKLEPGNLLEVESNKINLKSCSLKDNYIFIKKWFKLNNQFSFSKNLINNKNEAIKFLHKALKKSVKDQLITDVPIGAFLSGGIDSSLIVSLMQSVSDTPINTFTIGFEDNKFDESIYAKKIAKHLKTNHNELILTHNDLLNQVPHMHNIYDEPFADSSQIPTYLLSKFASSKVKVSLSGDGGDELFGGYNRYIWSMKIWVWLKFIPIPLRLVISKFLLMFSDNFLNSIEIPINKYILKNTKINNFPEKIKKLYSKINNSKNFQEFYLSLVSEWDNITDLLKISYDNSVNDIFNITPNEIIGNTEKMMFWDYISYLPDDILCKLDRAAMSNSLETRVPFLDNNIINIAFNLPLELKINKNTSKWILRQILKDYLPNKLIDRPKMGFSIPLAKWLRGPLKDWCQHTLDHNILKNSSLFNYSTIQNTWNEHIEEKKDNHNKIWSLLVFVSWLENQNYQSDI